MLGEDQKKKNWPSVFVDQSKWNKTSALFPACLHIQKNNKRIFIKSCIFERDYYDENKEDSGKSEDVFFLSFEFSS